jgi:hypothetical protein
MRSSILIVMRSSVLIMVMHSSILIVVMRSRTPEYGHA